MADQKSPEKGAPQGDVLGAMHRWRKEAERYKNELDKVRRELAQTVSQSKKLEQQLEVARAEKPDDVLSEAEKKLMTRWDEIQDERHKLEEDLTTFKERERQMRAKELATEKGIDVEALLAEEDIDSAALRLFAEKLAQENEELKKSQGSTSVYESATPTVIKKNVWDMSTQEFKEHEEKLKREVLSKK